MSTIKNQIGMYLFIDKYNTYCVYSHYNNDPLSAIAAIEKALAYSWPLPRFEADEFATGFIAANKTKPGHLRLLQVGNGIHCPYSEVRAKYKYNIYFKDNDLWIKVYEFKRMDKLIMEGTIANIKYMLTTEEF